MAFDYRTYYLEIHFVCSAIPPIDPSLLILVILIFLLNVTDMNMTSHLYSLQLGRSILPQMMSSIGLELIYLKM